MNQTLNVDEAEIAKFEALAARWWDPDGEFRPLHEINPLRANWIDARAPVAGKAVLDVGCGGGILSESMALRGARVTAIDMGEGPLSVARLHQLESGVEVDYRQSTAEALADAMPEQFDVVCCLEMLEHVPDPCPRAPTNTPSSSGPRSWRAGCAKRDWSTGRARGWCTTP